MVFAAQRLEVVLVILGAVVDEAREVVWVSGWLRAPGDRLTHGTPG